MYSFDILFLHALACLACDFFFQGKHCRVYRDVGQKSNFETNTTYIFATTKITQLLFFKNRFGFSESVLRKINCRLRLNATPQG